MRVLTLAGVALLGFSPLLLPHAAWAGEGNGNPFPGPSASVTSSTGSFKGVLHNASPYGFSAAAHTVRVQPMTFAKAPGNANPYPFTAPGTVISDGKAAASPGAAPQSYAKGTTSSNHS